MNVSGSACACVCVFFGECMKMKWSETSAVNTRTILRATVADAERKIESIQFDCMCALCSIVWFRRNRTIFADATQRHTHTHITQMPKNQYSRIRKHFFFLSPLLLWFGLHACSVFGIFIACGAFDVIVTFVFSLNTYHKYAPC